MTRGNIIALLVSYIYAFGLLGLGEVIRKWRGYSQAFTRKLVQSGNSVIDLCPIHDDHNPSLGSMMKAITGTAGLGVVNDDYWIIIFHDN